MGCEVRQFPVTDFWSDHPFKIMNEHSSPHRRREETFPVRSALPSREDMELARQLVGHSHGKKDSQPTPNEQKIDSPSPSQEFRRPEPTLSTTQEAPRPASLDREEREKSQSYSPVVSQSGPVPSGQVCRYVGRILQ